MARFAPRLTNAHDPDVQYCACRLGPRSARVCAYLDGGKPLRAMKGGGMAALPVWRFFGAAMSLRRIFPWGLVLLAVFLPAPAAIAASEDVRATKDPAA